MLTPETRIAKRSIGNEAMNVEQKGGIAGYKIAGSKSLAGILEGLLTLVSD